MTSTGSSEVPNDDPHRIHRTLDRLPVDRGMPLTELADRVGVTVVNLSVLTNDRARAVRFSTLTAICDVLARSPGDVLSLLSGGHPGSPLTSAPVRSTSAPPGTRGVRGCGGQRGGAWLVPTSSARPRVWVIIAMLSTARLAPAGRSRTSASRAVTARTRRWVPDPGGGFTPE